MLGIVSILGLLLQTFISLLPSLKSKTNRSQKTIDNKFNKSECEKPLMATSNPTSWYEGVEGCGLQCMNPLFNQQEHDEMHTFIAVWASITAVCTLFAMVSGGLLLVLLVSLCNVYIYIFSEPTTLCAALN